MKNYNPGLKGFARNLRINMTDAEQKLWHHLRRKQLLDTQFYRQKPIGNYIVDFYAPKVGLVIEIDGSQHMSTSGLEKDATRSTYLNNQGLVILRYDNLQILN